MATHSLRSRFPASRTQGSCVIRFFVFFPSSSWNFAECFALDQLEIAAVNNSFAGFCRGAVVAAALHGRGTTPQSPELPKGCSSLGRALQRQFPLPDLAPGISKVLDCAEQS